MYHFGLIVKVVVISGSPRENANTEIMMKHVVNYVKQKDVEVKLKSANIAVGSCDQRPNSFVVSIFKFLNTVLFGCLIWLSSICLELTSFFELRFVFVSFLKVILSVTLSCRQEKIKTINAKVINLFTCFYIIYTTVLYMVCCVFSN